MTEDEEILHGFLQEARESLERLELDLVALEAAPGDPDLLVGIYRAMHTMKGTSGFLGLTHLETATHHGEDVLDALRDGGLGFRPAIATTLLALVDDLRIRVERLERTGEDDAPVDPRLLRELAALASGGDARDARGAPSAPTAPAAPAAPAAPPDALPAPASDPPPVAPGNSIRVDAALLDTLMDLAGELVLVRGRLAELTAGESGGELVDTYRHLRRSTGELLESVRQARLQPLGTVMRKVPRIARDLAVALDKQVAVALSGEEVGVDRTINEALGDALLHLVRNAVDHGLETPGERVAAGKPATGRIAVTAASEGGRVRVEITDDGRGIDGERLAGRALERGLIGRDAAARLDAAERRELIFLPGLSSREQASAVSGRGVGMDAVRAHLARVGGTVEIVSVPGGAGTTLRIDVPLTLAIVSSVVVRSAGQRFCIPQTGVREVVSLPAHAPTAIGGARLHRTRDGLIPLVDLDALFGTAPHPEPGAHAEAPVTAVIVESQGRRLGLIVDAVGDPIEAVVKPLPPSVRGVRVFSGVTILADGRPTLILDLDGLAGHVGLSHPVAEPALEPEAPAGPERVELLLARGREDRRLGVPATQVWRVERIGRERLRQGPDLELLDYEDSLLPLVRLDATAEADLEVIVCVCAGGQLGLVVDAIDDVAEADLIVAPRDGRAGLARLDAEGGVAEVLDVDAYAPTVALAR